MAADSVVTGAELGRHLCGRRHRERIGGSVLAKRRYGSPPSRLGAVASAWSQMRAYLAASGRP